MNGASKRAFASVAPSGFGLPDPGRPMYAPKTAPSSSAPDSSAPPVADGLVDAFGRRCHRIADVDALPPFFLALASASDLWAFVTSNGAIAAGRGDPDGSLFPYQSVDRLYDAPGRSGPFTAVLVGPPCAAVLWQPFAPGPRRDPRVRRHLYKSVEGDRLWFEEEHAGLGLVFRAGWCTSARHGLVRTAELVNRTGAPVALRVLDGLLNVQPSGVPRRVQDTSSCLADAYKTAEVLEGSTLAVFALSAGIVDRPVALESLRASIVWSSGLEGSEVLLTSAQRDAWLEERPFALGPRCRGVRTHYLISATVQLGPQGGRSWLLTADTGLDQAAVVRRRQAVAVGLDAAAVAAAADETTARLREIVAAADGVQQGADETVTAHHFANVLFNLMRGGTFVDGSTVPGPDFAHHVAAHNRSVAARHAEFLAALPAAAPRTEFLARIATRADPDLARLAEEYLPLTFSRRHGDPSRPWNRFQIRLQDEAGRRLLAYEGNWRDIFQNWEALGCSYPVFFDAFIAKFLNASTADGHNPYRLSQRGIDWEAPEPDDPWASIGYWGDHQVIYLQKLLEWSARHRTGGLLAAPRTPRFAYADVPYRLASYESMRRNPRATVEFRRDLHRAIEAREAVVGADARLLVDESGAVLHVSLVEKLLVLVLNRLTNLVPGGGLWMNTQRPEWNDANNALVGHGLSVVTLGYLRRMLAHLAERLVPSLGADDVPVSSRVATLLDEVIAALEAHRALLDRPEVDDGARRAALDAFAAAGSRYRAALYAAGPGGPAAVPVERIARLLDLALRYTDHALAANRREDGLYHAYNLLEFVEEPAALRLHRLPVMLEGQVSILSSGLLPPAAAVALLRALRASPLYRADQHSYILYPDRELPGFLERNVLSAAAVRGCPLFERLLAAGDRRLVGRDDDGRVRFHADLVNAEALESRLDALGRDPEWAGLVAAAAPAVREAYEAVFHHHAFTGRSGTMFGYEGLGCIYWHMVAKLLLAVQENHQAALAAGAPEAADLAAHFHDIRAGLGFNKTAAEFGALPADPYSHTPGHSGAQQPGMTGQVKEEILTRWGELGVQVEDGRVAFRPTLLRVGEFAFDGVEGSAGALAFTLCGVPVTYRVTPGDAATVVRFADGRTVSSPHLGLDAGIAAAVFARDGSVAGIEVRLGRSIDPRPSPVPRTDERGAEPAIRRPRAEALRAERN